LYDYLLSSELVLAYSSSVPDTMITVIADKNTVQQETFVAIH